MHTHSLRLKSYINNFNYRNDNNNDKTKNEQLKIVLDSITEPNTELTKNILDYTINIISGNSKNNTPIMLMNNSTLIDAINFLTANSSKYFPKNITRGAVQIIFATCYSLVKQNQIKYVNVDTLDLSNRNNKIKLVNDTIKNLDNNLVINFPNGEYFDIISINKEELNISGNGYNYTNKFFGAKLSGANLTEAKLPKANLTKANLTKANLTKADLPEADLTEANLTKANLPEANLTKANLTKANLTKANLPEANLTKANLPEANLINANLTWATLIGAKLTWANLIKATLIGANLTNAKLTWATLIGANLTKAKLTWADLSGANLTLAKLIWARLTGATLTGADLTLANLTNADLTNANLENVYLRGAKFNGAIFDDNTKITLSFSNNLDLDFNHLNNDYGTILTAIDSIDDKDAKIKNDLMAQVFNYLKDKDIGLIIDSLNDIIFNSNYMDALIAVPEFKNKFFAKVYAKGNTVACKFKEYELNMHLEILKLLNEEELKKFTLDNNGFFIQLIHNARKTDVNKENANELYKRYLTLHGMINDKELINTDLKNSYNFNDFLNSNMMLISQNGDELLIIDNRYIDKFLYNTNVDESNEHGGHVNWTGVLHIKNNFVQNDKEQNLETLFNTFKIFHNSYNFALKYQKFIKLLDLLNLDDYKDRFLEAIKVKSCKDKFISPTHQENLNKIFENFFEDVFDDSNTKITLMILGGENAKNKLQIKPDHINEIFNVYDIQNISNEDKASVLLTLCGVFTKYSSSCFFGTELDSPLVLRYYAYGLMKEASRLNPNIIPNDYSKNDTDDWVNKLLGIKDAFSCTAALSYSILEHCEKHRNYKSLLSGLIPPAWS